MIPLVVASEVGKAQTGVVFLQCRGSRTALLYFYREKKPLENGIIEGDNPVFEACEDIAVS